MPAQRTSELGMSWKTHGSCGCLVLGHNDTGLWELLGKCQRPRETKGFRLFISRLGHQPRCLLCSGKASLKPWLCLSCLSNRVHMTFFLEPASPSLVDLILSLQASGPCHIHLQVSVQARSSGASSPSLPPGPAVM